MRANLDIDINNEELISLSAVGEMLPGSRGAKSVSPITIYRWTTSGSRAADGTRVRLASVRIGSRVYTSRQAVQRYVTALSLDHHENEIRDTPAQSRADNMAAKKSLKARGIVIDD